MTGGMVGTRVGAGFGEGVGEGDGSVFAGVGVSEVAGGAEGEGEFCCVIIDSGVGEAEGTTLVSKSEAEFEISGISIFTRSIPKAAKNKKTISSEYINNGYLRFII